MKYIVNLMTVLAVMFAPLMANAQSAAGTIVEGTQTPGFYSTRNLIKNPGAEKNLQNVTASGGSLTRSTSTPLEGGASFLIDASSSGQTYTFATATIEEGMKGRNCEARFSYAGDATLYTAAVYEGSNQVSQSVTLSNVSSGAQPASLLFPCGTGASALTLKITSTSASAAAIKVDSVYLGLAVSLGSVSQAQFLGQINIACGTNASITSASMTDAVGASCTYSTTGSAAQPATSNLVGIRLQNQGPGEYMVVATFTAATSALGSGRFRLSDGTSTGPSYYSAFAAGEQHNIEVSHNFTYTTPQSDLTFKVQALRETGTQPITIPPGGTAALRVYKFPSTSDAVYRPDTYPWYVDANIGGTNISLGTPAVSSYSEIGNASMVLTKNSGSAPVGISCYGSETSVVGNTTCSVSESLGITFNVPTAGAVRACVSFAWQGITGASGNVVDAFEIVETAANSSTILQEGKSRVNAANSVASTIVELPFQTCGVFNFSSSGQKTLRLAYEQFVSGTVSSSTLIADGSTSIGQRDIHWEVYPITQQTPAPLLVNSVVAPDYNGVTRVNVVNWLTSSSTLTESQETIEADATSGALTFTLPDAVAMRGKKYHIVKVDTSTNAINLATTSSQAINAVAASNFVLRRYFDNITLQSDGGNWLVLGSNVNSSKYTGQERLERVILNTVCTTSPCTIFKQSGSWLSSITRNSAGDYVLNVATGIFSDVPSCTCSATDASGNGRSCMIRSNNATTTSVPMTTANGAGTFSDTLFSVNCQGPR